MNTVDRACLKLAASQHWVIARTQLLLLGLSATGIDRRLSSGLFVRLHPSVYRIGAAPESWRQRLLGACLWTDGVASHRSALMLLGLEGYGEILEVTTTVTRRTSTRAVRMTNLAPFELTTVDSIRVDHPDSHADRRWFGPLSEGPRGGGRLGAKAAPDLGGPAADGC
ncbi:MAG: type IV toxin-antitoxin system AbiEi family antitoxin domain-containing protein [Actinomycetota bacterium]